MGNAPSRNQVNVDERYKPTKLFKYVQKKNWAKAVQRTAQYPNECSQWVRVPAVFVNKAEEGNGSFRGTGQVKDDGQTKRAETTSTLLPIMQACYNRPPAMFILSQLQAFPNSIQMQDDYDRMPLHLACMEYAGLEVVKTLLFWNPRCAMVEDKNGCLPIHLSMLALYKHHSRSIIVDPYDSVRMVELLLKAYPESSSYTNCRGDTPLTLFYTTNEVLKKRENYLGQKWFRIMENILKRDTDYWRSVRPMQANDIVADYLSDRKLKSQGLASYDIEKPPPSSLASTALLSDFSTGDFSSKPAPETKESLDSFEKESNSHPDTSLIACINMKDWNEVTACLETNPEQAKIPVVTKLSNGDEWNRSPLFEAIRMKAPHHVVKMLIDIYPSASQMKESVHFRLPLHIACIEKSSYDIVHTLLEVNPSGAQAVESKYSGIPLHFAVSNGSSIDVVLNLLTIFPDGAKTTDKDGWLPLHHACAKGAPVDVVNVLLCSHPEGAQRKESLMGRIPLHFSALKGTSTDIVEALLKVYPNSADCANFFGSTPKMMASKNVSTAKESIMEALGVEKAEISESVPSNLKSKQSAGTSGTRASNKLCSLITGRDWRNVLDHLNNHPDEAGMWIESRLGDGTTWRRLPITEALTMFAPQPVIFQITSAYPQGASQVESLHHRTPLHIACAQGMSESIIDLLLAANPGGARRESKNQSLPIHLACANGVSVEGIRSLVKGFEAGIRTIDSDGWLPLHHACAKGASTEVVEFLLSLYPYAAEVQEKSIGRLPIHLAAYKGAHPNVLRSLLRSYPASSSMTTFTGSTPTDLASRGSSKYKDETLKILNASVRDSSVNGILHENSSLSTKHLMGIVENSQSRTQIRASKHLGKVTTDLISCIVKRDWDKAMEVIQANPEEVSIWNEVDFDDDTEWRRLPIHEACRLQPPLFVIEELLQTFPGGAREQDHDGWLPLHLACECSASDGVVKALLRDWPTGAQTLESLYGYLPLHVACCFGCSEYIIENLLRTFPESISFRTKANTTPLDLTRFSTNPNKAAIIGLLQKGVNYWTSLET